MTRNSLTDDAQATAAENRQARLILMVTLGLIVLCAASVTLFGLPALGVIGLAGTAACFAALIAFMLGN
ncbi:hypothetical protein SAMN05421538_108166 [Paracoccus isoporae]|uniref:Uncharacterized protein n=1 Tax=Paracoccus isoporae TaxID=591205 RepID=A0A1G7ECT2_9RHOB|nr:hypothetical protein [Paracoccus isoporae]SDE61459.1 hypothetical protein SAMN05421538_108166 [Paracoccus isoporae]